jgi:hypothetical protein
MIKVYCRTCGVEIHPMRLEALPNTKVCVKCSQEGKKAGRLVAYGTGEEVETRLEIQDADTYRKTAALEAGVRSNVKLSEMDIFHNADEDKEDVDPYKAYSNTTSADLPEE